MRNQAFIRYGLSVRMDLFFQECCHFMSTVPARIAFSPRSLVERRSQIGVLLGFIVLAVVYFASRTYALTIMPLHFDEEVHLTRALEVWRGHPFWDISDGRIINQWAIALFYPQNVPVFVARIATILVSLPGFAAGYALAKRWFGRAAGLLAAAAWIACPYVFFYERTALIDAEAGSLAVIAVWASLRLIRTGRRRDAALTGLALAIAMLFKFSALPFMGSVGLIVLFMGKATWRQRLVQLVIIGLVILACFAVPLLYAATHHGFSVVAGWFSGSNGQGLTLRSNFETLWAQVVNYGSVIWALLLGIGWIGAVSLLVSPSLHAGVRYRWRDLFILLGAVALPLAAILLAVSNVMPRHLVVGVPILLVVAGCGLAIIFEKVSHLFPYTGILTAAVIVLLAVGFLPFARTAYTDPGSLPLPPIERQQYQTGYSAGFGLREAVLDFPRTLGPAGIPVVASMYPDGCRLANFYDVWHYDMHCTNAPGLDTIRSIVASLPTNGVMYILAESQPIGLDPAWMTALLSVEVTRVAGYPRPGETPDTASVVLWKLERIAG